MHEEQGSWTSLGLLFLRVLAGGLMLLGHGRANLVGSAEIAPMFPDPPSFSFDAGTRWRLGR